MYVDILQKIGLGAGEAQIYELLLTNGAAKASDLVPLSGLGRVHVYKVLTQLVARGFVEVVEGKQKVYRAAEPSKLSLLVEEQKRKTDRLSAEFREELPKLLSTFNLTTGKPAIQVFEGIDGFTRALEDSLSAKGEICTIGAPARLSPVAAEVNRDYVKKRIKKGIVKRILIPDTPENLAYFSHALPYTEVRAHAGLSAEMPTTIEMYDDQASFLTVTDTTMSVLMHDAHIVASLRMSFEALWGAARMVTLPPAHVRTSQ